MEERSHSDSLIFSCRFISYVNQTDGLEIFSPIVNSAPEPSMSSFSPFLEVLSERYSEHKTIRRRFTSFSVDRGFSEDISAANKSQNQCEEKWRNNT